MPGTKEDVRYDSALAVHAQAAFLEAFAGMTQADIGKIIDADQGTVSRYQNGKTQVPFRVLLLVSQRLRRGLDDILKLPWLPSEEERGRAWFQKWLMRGVSGATSIFPTTPISLPLDIQEPKKIVDASLAGMPPTNKRNKSDAATDKGGTNGRAEEGLDGEVAPKSGKSGVGKRRSHR